MVKKHLLLLSLILGGISLASCSNEDELTDFNSMNDVVQTENSSDTDYLKYKRTPEEAEDLVLDFLSEVSAQQVMSSKKRLLKQATPKIANVEALSKSSSMKRGKLKDIEPVSGIDTLLYMVNFTDDSGFAIVAADKRTDPLIAFIDEGNFSAEDLATEENEGFLLALESAIDNELADIEAYNEDSVTQTNHYQPKLKDLDTKGWTINTIKTPLLQTNWGQGIPYNTYCPELPDYYINIGNHAATGCVITALAQMLSYYQVVTEVPYVASIPQIQTTLHWSQIIQDSQNNNGHLNNTTSQSTNEVACLMRYLGTCITVDYGVTSGAQKEDATNFLKVKGLNVSKWADFKESRIINTLSQNYIMFGSGYGERKKIAGITYKYTKGHVWIYDGYLNATKDNNTLNMVHCNWGWNGTRNGYYFCKVFNTRLGGEIPDDGDNTYIESLYDFRYKFEYAIVANNL
ncbi:hypothetical protein C7Y71_000785 [Pseudoprevotella muciniphila]|uniref:Spi protease inhibitor domain-containing protein n=1 Tax=Pseudoprevotella muciniphila TaxID=2133944 RepID=A0A5P8E407_9BACT|nr:C10 family peptidase [Pseudoprevotella muciniphila]QFQ11676.1 hypothetical protein C7Y71_000785 [Pseudoprevotella muciniphila]